MIHKMGYECQCERCAEPGYYDEMNIEGYCEHCHDDIFNRAVNAVIESAKMKLLYDAEKRAGLLDTPEDHRAKLKDAGRL